MVDLLKLIVLFLLAPIVYKNLAIGWRFGLALTIAYAIYVIGIVVLEVT